ncbi:TetR/AcrR family transcriptional repressor of nem operon [Lysobacter enzymogenes]|uniref:TetR/AcrR family transcriptional regulator n=1 Tax=Lysobacter enzymogenes TaxID=69 RepID=UPI0033929CC2
MKVSREQVGENRRRILDQAGRLFRERGFEGVSVAQVMKAAGLTHGAFYGHFQSKDELIAQTLAHVLAGSEVAAEPEVFLAGYLSSQHCADAAGGCPVAGLGAETLRQSPQARAAMTAGLREQLQRMSETAPGTDAAARRREAIGRWSAMVGALTLARLSDDAALSDEILEQARSWIGERDAQ